MSKITVTNLSKHFNQHEVLKDVSLQANQGEVIALLGSSGSGKSTLLRCINLLEIPDRGVIQIGNDTMKFGPQIPTISHKQMTAVRVKVGMVFQQFNLWMHLTVLDNLITAPMHVLKIKKAEAIAQAQVLLQKVGILEKQNAFPAQLSGGQQQRVAIARALMMKPQAMLFDEPTSALDPEMIGEVLQVIRNLAQEGMTMIIASHEMSFARDVANKVIFLDQGKILEEGNAKEVFANPQTQRLQKFLETVKR